MHVFPVIGAKPLREVTPADVLTIIEAAQARGNIETAHGLRTVIGQVCRYAKVTGRADADPTADLRGALRALKYRHMPAVTRPEEAGALMAAIADYRGSPIVRSALQIAALTFQRPGNVRAMEWSEIDFEAGMWTIPAMKMKRKKADKENGPPHYVPLSTQSIAALRAVQPLTGHGRYVFPGQRIRDSQLWQV